MNRLGRTSFVSVFVAPRAWVERLVFLALVSAAVLLLVLGRSGLNAVDDARADARDLLSPLVGLVAQPTRAWRDGVGWVGDHFALADENRRLRDELSELLAWQAEATRLQVENAALRDVLRAHRARPVPLTRTAQVIADSRSPFVHTRLLDAGRSDGVEEGMAAVGTGGFAGRLVDVGERSARLLLVTDFNSRVPVIVLPSRDPAILAGDNGTLPKLDFLPLTPSVEVGDRVVTSGTGGVIPAGLPVGRVVEVDVGGVRVEPSLDWHDLEFVRLVDVEPVDDLVALDDRRWRPLPGAGVIGR
ncbi:MAG: rod shape-determining protein MreC [Pseudomonadota bacterium]